MNALLGLFSAPKKPPVKPTTHRSTAILDAIPYTPMEYLDVKLVDHPNLSWIRDAERYMTRMGLDKPTSELPCHQRYVRVSKFSSRSVSNK